MSGESGTTYIFGIGLNKTGTRSLARALRLLGVRTLHRGDQATSDLVEQAIVRGEPPLSLISDKFEAYLDVAAIVHHFEVLDQHYPGSRFILTTCDEDSWVKSREQHVLANQRNANRGQYSGGWLKVDVDQWRKEWALHHQAVRDYFGGRQADLLVLDIRSGDGWEPLCAFLGLDRPLREFPWENRAGSGTYRLFQSRSRWRLRLAYLAARWRRKVGMS